jgi:hypothetical protein
MPRKNKAQDADEAAPISAVAAPKNKNKSPALSPWRSSRAKEHLHELLLDQSSWVHILTDEQIHEAEPLFKQYPLKQFTTNISNMNKAAIVIEGAAIEFDQLALDSDNYRFPRKDVSERGYDFWDGHDAQRLLAADVKEGRTARMKPTQLHQSRDKYKELPLAVFRSHISQEELKKREKVYWQNKRNDKARKNHEN